MLKRVQLMLDAELDTAVEREARRLGVSRSELVRRLLREQLVPDLPALEDDPIWDFVGMTEGAADDSQQIDKVVYGPLEAGR